MSTGSLLGYLDEFEYKVTPRHRALLLQGWLLGVDARVRSVVVKQRHAISLPVPYGLPRPDVARAYPHDPNAHAAGFGGSIILPPSTSRHAPFHICAVLEDGQEVHWLSRSPAGRARVWHVLTTARQRALSAYRDGRLTFQLGQWLHALKARCGHIVAARAAASSDRARRHRYRDALKGFLDSPARLAWLPESPTLSIVIVHSRRPELLLRCLRGLQGLSAQVNLVLGAHRASRTTARVLDRLDGVRLVRESGTRSPWAACREAARGTSAKHVLLLSDDAEVAPGSLEAAVRTLESDADIGAVGARVISADGPLKEAGGIAWSDGSLSAYGAGHDPQSPPYMYMRDVDYCSAAFLLTRRELFVDLASGGASEYGRRLRAAGKRVVYDPRVVIEVDSRPEDNHASAPARAGVELLDARSAARPRQKILVIDSQVPHVRLGAGFPRAVELIRSLTDLGHFVTFYAMMVPQEEWSEVYEDIPRTVEVVTGSGERWLRLFLEEREGFYDQILVSRPHNMEMFRANMWINGSWATRARVVYDSEAILSLREAEQRRLSGEAVGNDEVARLLAAEMSLIAGVHAVLAVTDKEREYFRTAGARATWTVGHAVSVTPTPRAFRERADFLFVGSMARMPNRDAVLWFAREIWPTLRALVGGDVALRVVGEQPPVELQGMSGIEVIGQVADLTPLYDRARVFVAPSRLAAGLPLKVQSAAANGLPIACTSILAEQLGWQHESELLVADEPRPLADCCARLYSDEGLWQRLRSRALHRVARECSRDAFTGALAEALSRK